MSTQTINLLTKSTQINLYLQMYGVDIKEHLIEPKRLTLTQHDGKTVILPVEQIEPIMFNFIIPTINKADLKHFLKMKNSKTVKYYYNHIEPDQIKKFDFDYKMITVNPDTLQVISVKK